MANKLLKSITFPDLTDKYIVGDTTLSVSGAGADAKATGDALATKANIDGSYDSMTVGNAEQLVSTVRANDKTPYIFRTSGGSVDIGDREYVNHITGGTVAWNQLAYSNRSGTLNRDSARTGSIGTNGQKALANHVYLLEMTITADNSNHGILTQYFNVSYRSDAFKGVGRKSVIVKNGSSNGSLGYIYAFLGTDEASGTETSYKDAFLIDLTQALGSGIADYINSLETAEVGAGVAWLKKHGFCISPSSAYNAGELKSVSGLVSHDMTGFNQWDEEWETGTISDETGQNASSNETIRSKNYIRVVPNTTYCKMCAKTGMIIFEYDGDKNYINVFYVANGTRTFAVSSNTAYIRFRMESPSYGATYTNDICINLAWDNSRNGEYEAYELHSYPLDSDLTLRGIPKLDANNNLHYDGDVYEPDGTVTRKYGIVDLGTLTWSRRDSDGLFYALMSDAKATPSASVGNIVTSKYVTVARNYLVDKTICIVENKNLCLFDTTYATAAAFKTAMSGVYLVYELATPTTETADPYQTPQIVDDFGTEEYVLNNSIVPVGHDTDYPVNLVAKLEMAPNSPEGDGMYVVKQTSGVNEYVPLIVPSGIPSVPAEDGTYTLTATVSDGTTTLSWS